MYGKSDPRNHTNYHEMVFGVVSGHLVDRLRLVAAKPALFLACSLADTLGFSQIQIAEASIYERARRPQ